ncbi:MAG TPA: HEAT repeat domain-containing protein [Gemmatimonadales bacterium]|nr:HEAT repeat domain-containing protein [Gemmatimonadales bacterium]
MSGTSATVLPPSQVEELIRTLVKALRAFQMYLPNNPIYQRAMGNVAAAFAPIWAATDELVLGVLESEFHWEGQVVYQQIARNESLAWTLYKDGMRALTFRKGVEREEIVRFLELVNRARLLPPDASDDLLTLLWEHDFQYLTYQFVEPLLDGPPLEAASTAPAPSAGVVQRKVQEEVEAERRRPGVVDLEEFESTLYFLDEREIAYLGEELVKEYAQDLRGNALAVLYDLFELQTDPAIRSEILGILDSVFPYLLNARDFRAVGGLLRELRVLRQRASALAPDQAAQLDGFAERLSSPAVLSQLLQTIDDATLPPSEQDLGDLFRELRPAALERLLVWLPTVSAERIRDVARAACERLADAHPGEIMRLLRQPGSAALPGALELCARLKLQGAIPALAELLGHADPQVRLGAVQALGAIGSPGALSHLARAIDDPHRDVRLAAVRQAGAHGYKGALRRIEAVVLRRDLKDADLTEKMAFFEAYGSIVGAAGLPALVALLAPRGGLLRLKQSPELRACAAIAIGKIRTPEARAALQAAMNDKELVVRNAASRALREMGR